MSAKKKKKKTNPKNDSIKIKVNNILFEFTPEMYNDYELLELISEADETANPLELVKLFKRLTGSQYEAAKKSLRDANGYISNDAVGQFVVKFFEAIGEQAPNLQRSS